ncbi:MAG: hydroxymethylpyrimidine/phosphomethylpyrimidine kinase, partial [Gammaproteobacteria bacterium]
LATFAALGCHGLTVVTGLMVADSARVDGTLEIEADWVSDQARTLLEDMHVAAIKIGALTTLEQISVVAEIASDYPDVPLVLDPFLSSLPEAGTGDDDMLGAIRQILVPQASVLLLSQDELGRMADSWRDAGPDGAGETAGDGAGDSTEDPLAHDLEDLTDAGCEYVLLKCRSSSGGGPAKSMCDVLYGQEGRVRTFEWKHLPGPFLGAGCTLSAAVTALMARGLDGRDAVAQAEAYIAGALAHAQRFGMGKLVPNKFYGYTFKE